MIAGLACVSEAVIRPITLWKWLRVALSHALIYTIRSRILHGRLPGLLFYGTQREWALPLIPQHHYCGVSRPRWRTRIVEIEVKPRGRSHGETCAPATNHAGNVGSLEDSQIRCQILECIGKLRRQVLKFFLSEKSIVQLHKDLLKSIVVEGYYIWWLAFQNNMREWRNLEWKSNLPSA